MPGIYLKIVRNEMKYKLWALSNNGRNPRLGINMTAESKDDRRKLKKLQQRGLYHGAGNNCGVISLCMFLHSSRGHSIKKCGFKP